jgi:hypothetical protein
MVSLSLRIAVLVAVVTGASTGVFAWRWPAFWRLPVRPGGTINQPPNDMTSRHSVAPQTNSTGWLLLITLMALLIGGWILLVVLT